MNEEEKLKFIRGGDPILFRYSVAELIRLYDLNKISFTQFLGELEYRMNQN